MAKGTDAHNLEDWIEAWKRVHLSHAHVQMARELGMNPKKLGKLDNHHQEPWKAPLLQFIERFYLNRFGRERPEVVMSVEEGRKSRRPSAPRGGRQSAAPAQRATGPSRRSLDERVSVLRVPGHRSTTE